MKTRTIIVAALASFGTAGAALAQSHYTAVPVPPGQTPPVAPPTDGPGLSIDWNTFDGGGRELAAGSLSIGGTIGQPDAGPMTFGDIELYAGYWGGVEYPAVPAPCYADCDNSTGTPRLTANDFSCFLNKYNTGNPYANCDGSTVAPVLNALDFICFMNKYASGCS